jgi:hypothetical protein
MKKSLSKKYEKATELNNRGKRMRIISEEEMVATVKKHEHQKRMFILRLQQIIDSHKTQNTNFKVMVGWVKQIWKDFDHV